MNRAEPAAGASRAIATRDVILFALFVFALRALASGVGSFMEGDEISIASGIAAIVRDVPGVTYRYGVQFGYYRLVAFLTMLTGGDLTRIPIVMSWLSLVSGVVIPVCGLFAFRDELSVRERWLVAALLTANPIIWLSARYGNTAMPSVACTALAITILSNRPRLLGEVVAMCSFAVAITLRADAVLVSGGVFFLLWRNHRAFIRAALPLALVGGTILVLPARAQGVGSVHGVGRRRARVAHRESHQDALLRLPPLGDLALPAPVRCRRVA